MKRREGGSRLVRTFAQAYAPSTGLVFAAIAACSDKRPDFSQPIASDNQPANNGTSETTDASTEQASITTPVTTTVNDGSTNDNCFGGCYIDGSCHSAGKVSEENPCRVCAPERSRSVWTNDDERSCDDGLYCTVDDHCSEGICVGSERNCEDETDCNGTETCDEAKDQCAGAASTCQEGEVCDVENDVCSSNCAGCAIDGNCYAEGESPQSNPCWICDAARSTEDWAANTHAQCNDGDDCTGNDRCSESGICAGTPALDIGGGCACLDNSDCNDDLTCTVDTCYEGTCLHTVEANSCVVDGSCRAHNSSHPSNSCLYCDATLSQSAWTNAAVGSSCDDGLWCNGVDTCNSGTCQHQFSGDERCAESGPCASDTCDEGRDSCFEPAGTICANIETVNRCADNTCGGSSQAVELSRACTGNSASCPTEANEEIVSTTSCAGDQACNAGTGRCGAALGCGDTYCDAAGGGLCWMTLDAPFTYTQQEALDYCDDLELAGRDNWHLPSVDEGRSIFRECDGRTMTCEVGEGPGEEGCYWPVEMGTCSEVYYWSSDESLVWIPSSALVTIYSSAESWSVRCATADDR